MYRYVVPITIEDAVNRSLYIAQSFVHGSNEKYNVILIIPEIAEV